MNRTAQTQKKTQSALSIDWHRCILACVIGILIDLILPCRVAAQSVPWTEVDIGSPGAVGSFLYATGTPPTYTVKGAGVGMGNSTDSLAFVGTPACGNFEIVARVSSQQNTGSGAIAGLCIRDCQQQYAQINAVYVTPGSGLNFAYRNHNGGGLNVVNGPPTQTAPVYLRLTRTGTATGGYTDTGYYSSDGISWTLVYAHTESNILPIPNKCYVGFIVSSSVNGTLNTTVFDHVSYMTSVPQQTANLLLWLRSDAGVTYGTSVSGWADQSGNSNNASQSTGTLQPTLSTGSVNSGILPSIAFNGSQYMTLPSGFANLTSGLSCFVVMNRATSTGTDAAFACGNSSNSDAAIAETIGTNAAMYCYKGSTSSNVTTTTTPISPGTFQLLDAEFQPGQTNGTGSLYVNDTLQAQATNLVSTLNNVTRTSNYVGNDSSLTHGFNGSIAEIIVYSGITPAQRAMVMSYILSKYALGTAPTLDAPTSSPSAGVFLPQQAVVLSQDQNATVYYTVDGSAPSSASSLWFYTNVTSALNYYPTLNIHVPQTETIKAMAVAPFFNNSAVMSQTFQVDPTTSGVPRNGLLMWLMGNNSVSTSGSNVTGWGDVSGSGNSATNAANQPTLVSGAVNGLPAVNFSSGSSQFLQVPAGMSNFSSGSSIFVVTKPTSVTAGARFLDFGNGATSDNIYLDEPSSTGASLFTYNGSTGSSVNSPSAITLGQYQVLEAIYNGTNTGTILTNAVQGGQSTAMSTLNNILRSNNYLAQGSSGGNYFNGQIAEILLFNRAITASEQAAIEGYLFNKYQALTSNTVAAPVISVASATLTGPTQVAIEATTGSTIYLTRDGSGPTTSSPVYTAPINISFSQTLKAIAVLNGVTSSVSTATYTLDSTQWPAPNPSDSTPLQLQLQLPSVGIPQDSGQR